MSGHSASAAIGAASSTHHEHMQVAKQAQQNVARQRSEANGVQHNDAHRTVQPGSSTNEIVLFDTSA